MDAAGRTRTPAIMFQGTGSDVGKSLLVAGLCRLYARAGLKVAPFKPQNMSNNAAVTAEGGEIGRAQALQARAAFRAPGTDMNPVLLKPEGETGSQLVVQGRREGHVAGRDYWRTRKRLMPAVLDSFERLSAGADLVLVEGAGSAAEVNLRANDIANMGFAMEADIPVVIVADIDRGGVIASLVGTHALLPEDERARIGGFVVNRFRGDRSLFREGAAAISARTGWPSLGIVPWFEAARALPAEDSVDLAGKLGGAEGGSVRIGVPLLPRIANFDDLDPLRLEPSVSLVAVRPGEALPGDLDLVVLPGSKATMSDLAALRREGWDTDIAAHVRRGGHVLGLCGGYQMLGRMLHDPDGIEGPPGSAPGLGLLDVETVLGPEKTLAERRARHVASGTPVTGYEMHLGASEGPDRARAYLELEDKRMDGAVSADGLAAGTYLHGLFAADAFRTAFLAGLGAPGSGIGYDGLVEATIDALADHLAATLDTGRILDLARGRGGRAVPGREAAGVSPRG